jgi:CheY-like chemotaxis protein
MQTKTTRVLVVDDRSDVLGFVRAALERAGYQVDVAQNGREAIAFQRQRPVDLLITDIFMPEADGMETIDRFKTEYPSTRIIAMSGGVERMQDYLQIADQIGVDATLRKPFTMEELLRAVRSVLAETR